MMLDETKEAEWARRKGWKRDTMWV